MASMAKEKSFPLGKQKFPYGENKVSPVGNFCFNGGKLTKLFIV